MNQNLKILSTKLNHLIRIQRDIDYSKAKMAIPLGKIKLNHVESLTENERETLAAFNSRFSSYQEQLAKAFKSIAIEEEINSESFGVVLALMDKLSILDDVSKWKEVRELRNVVNHVYEDDAEILFQALHNMIENVTYLHSVHSKMREFVVNTYIAPLANSDKRSSKS